ncbi:MAG: Membrane protein insertase YidC [Verrucomicrobia subdivision 3 bacterium]|nr:Membrane protein insertase YidC [Limisphaerales bacterium]MCS1417007.1 Membrane protein insertase YidC [Limisphaerales bacterium]
MDRKSILIFAVAFVLLLAWGPFVNTVLYPPDKRRVSGATNEVTQAESPEVANPGLETSSSNGAESMPSVEITMIPDANPSFTEELATLENDGAKYWFSNAGGGIHIVDLKHYPNDTGCGPEADQGLDSKFAQLNPWTSETILGLRLGEAPLIQGYDISEEPGTVKMVRELEGGLRIEKEFELGTNYLIRAKTRVVNKSDSVKVIPSQHWLVGTSTPMTPEDNGILMGLMYFNGAKIERIKESWFANRTLGCFPGQPRNFFQYEETPINWASVGNQFFTIALIPKEAADRVEAMRSPLKFSGAEATEFKVKQGYQTSLVFKGQTLPPGESIEREFNIFAGPKEYDTLARLSSEFGNELDGIMDFGGFFGFFAKALLLSMNGLNGMGLSYGFSIVVITFIIKLLFWPLTQASTRSMKRMAALQPQMKDIQDKYKDDPQKMNKKLMEFMRENRVSPLGGCLPILLQLPVFFGFYTMLQSAIELRGASFLWTCDLSKPDTLFIIPGLGIPFNLWPLLMGAAQLWQTSMTPMSPGMDPMQQKIMKYMPLIFVFILYNFSAGLALYWTVQNLLSIVQMKLTKNEPIAAGPAPRAPLGKKKSKGKKGRPRL